MRFTVVPTQPLLGDYDVEASAREIPKDHVMKGMFFSRYLKALGSKYRFIEEKLEAPPRLGKYLPFSFYPFRDFMRIFDAAARQSYPEIGVREAHRREARNEVDVFVESTLGKVTFSLVENPQTALARYPEIFRVLVQGPKVRLTRTGKYEVTIDYKQHYGSLGYTIGVIEALVSNFDATPELNVDDRGGGVRTIVCSWTPSAASIAARESRETSAPPIDDSARAKSFSTRAPPPITRRDDEDTHTNLNIQVKPAAKPAFSEESTQSSTSLRSALPQPGSSASHRAAEPYSSSSQEAAPRTSSSSFRQAAQRLPSSTNQKNATANPPSSFSQRAVTAAPPGSPLDRGERAEREKSEKPAKK